MGDKRSASVSGGMGLVAAGLVTVVLLVAGLFVFTRQTAEVDEAAVEAVIAPADPVVSAPSAGAPKDGAAAPAVSEPDTSTSAEAEAPEPQETTADASEAQAPSVDEVRVEPGGAMVVAGRAAPGTRVDVLVDGDVVASAEADASGSFAALGTVSAQDNARSLTLRSGTGETATTSEEEIILAPVPQRQADASTGDQDLSGLATGDPADTPAGGVGPVDGGPDSPGIEGEMVTEEVVAQLTGTDDATVELETSAGEGEVSAVEPVAGSAAAETGGAADPDTETSRSAEPEATTEDQRIAVLRSDVEGVTLVPTEPVAPASVVLDTISYGDDGTLRLSGRASAEVAEVRAYLDNAPVARLPVAEGGTWRGEVPDVDPGVYTLRIDALRADGTVSARIETPFQREAPAILAAAAASQTGPVRSVTVQAGDTLWAIARQRYGEGILYVQVYDANRAAIRDPDLIYPGQVFELPAE